MSTVNKQPIRETSAFLHDTHPSPERSFYERMSVRLASSHEHFQRCFRVFLDKSDEHESSISCIREGIKPMVKSLATLIDAPTVRVLGVGSGKGEIDLEILHVAAQCLHEKNPNHKSDFLCHVVEPNREGLEGFKSSVEVLPAHLANLANMKFEWHQGTFQQYIDKQDHEMTKFEVVHFVQSLYYFADFEDALVHSYEKILGDKGVIICMLLGEGSYIHRFAHKFHDNGKFQFPGVKYHCNQDVVAVAKKYNFPYEEYSKEFHLDVTEVFDAKSEKGNSLLDFITHTMNFRATASCEEVEEVLKFLEEVSSVEDGKRLAKGRCWALMIKKGFGH